MNKPGKVSKNIDVERRCKAFHHLQEMATGATVDLNKSKEPEFAKGIAMEYWGGHYDQLTGIFTKTGPAYSYK